MIQKKIHPILVVLMMLLSLAIVAIPVQAELHRVSGYLYIDGNPAPADVQVVLSFDDGDETDYTSATGYYQMAFNGHDFKKGDFNVFYNGNWYTPFPSFVLITKPVHETDLNVNTSGVTNSPPYISIISPSNGTSGIGINADLKWSGGDPDGDNVTYDVYFGDSSPPTKVTSTPQSGTTYDPGTMNYTDTYYWQIVAYDDHGHTATGPIWSFTTASESTPGGGGSGTTGGGGTGGVVNNPPTADASASETTGVVGVPVSLDGSLSSDSDGSIVNYTWNFGDGESGYGWVTTHVYGFADTYDVTLTVRDNDGSIDTHTIQVIISARPNIPPTDPDVDGPTSGTKNTDYDYTAVSTDDDNDTIQYVFNWGDGDTTSTDFLANGTATTQTHDWNSAGVYTIEVKAYDNETFSGITSYAVLIDAMYVGEIGYLIDDNADGTYETFHSFSTGEETTVQKLENGSYLINSDVDEAWDYIYDPQTDNLLEYSEGTTGEDYSIWSMLLVGVIIVIVILVAIATAMRAKEKPKKSKTKKKK